MSEPSKLPEEKDADLDTLLCELRGYLPLMESAIRQQIVVKLIEHAEQARREEREQAAKVCEDKAEQSHIDGYDEQRDIEWRCAHAIRARSNTEPKKEGKPK